jgi:hypothetical protein
VVDHLNAESNVLLSGHRRPLIRDYILYIEKALLSSLGRCVPLNRFFMLFLL